MTAPTRRFLLTSVFVILSGAAVAQPAYEPIPPLREEIVPPPPHGPYIWRPGHWLWDGRGYAWEPGVYVPRSHQWHEWVHGGWELRHGRWEWEPPHWR